MTAAEPLRTERVSCPVCGGRRWRRAVRGADFEVVRCAGCTLGRTLPSPGEADGREHFADDDAHYRQSYLAQRALRYAFAAQMLAILQRFKREGRVLDIGCGIGVFVEYARRHGFACEGIDRSSGAARAARDELGVDLVTGNFADQAAAWPGAFDAVTMNHVLEHVSAPVAFLDRVVHVLKRDGVVVSASPNFGGLVPRILGRRWYGLQPSQHVWQFTPESYRAAFERVGLRVEQTIVDAMHYAPGSTWKSMVVYGLARLGKAVGRGDNVFVVGRKG